MLLKNIEKIIIILGSFIFLILICFIFKIITYNIGNIKEKKKDIDFSCVIYYKEKDKIKKEYIKKYYYIENDIIIENDKNKVKRYKIKNMVLKCRE